LVPVFLSSCIHSCDQPFCLFYAVLSFSGNYTLWNKF
jgi:hypothetical protein